MINHFVRFAIVCVGFLVSGCGNSTNKNDPSISTIDAGQVSFEFGEATLNEALNDLPSRDWFLLASGKKWPLGRLEGSVELVPSNQWAEHRIPENALAVAHNYHGADFYYYAIKENGRIVIYVGGPYMDEKDGELKYVYDERIEPLLLGKWEAKGSPENWVSYDARFYYLDGFEDGISYRIQGDTMFTGMGDTQIIEKLMENEFIARDVEGTYTNHWLKAKDN
jgi:hypothetical protein